MTNGYFMNGGSLVGYGKVLVQKEQGKDKFESGEFKDCIGYGKGVITVLTAPEAYVQVFDFDKERCTLEEVPEDDDVFQATYSFFLRRDEHRIGRAGRDLREPTEASSFLVRKIWKVQYAPEIESFYTAGLHADQSKTKDGSTGVCDTSLTITTATDAVYTPLVDLQPNEKMLFHGTRTESVDSMLTRAGWAQEYGRGGYFGKGYYFAEFPGKSDEYTVTRDKKSQVQMDTPSCVTAAEEYDNNVYWKRSKDNERYMFICKVNLGCPAIVTKDSFMSMQTWDGQKIGDDKFKGPISSTSFNDLNSNFGSIIYERNKEDPNQRFAYREVIVQEEMQALPMYLVQYNRNLDKALEIVNE
jgi:hypothetical protein